MIVDVNMRPLVPAFIMADQNGYAMAKALEKAMVIFCETISNGLDIINNVENMPEWRLDEMAWELDCFYDYSADIESKREWIRSATPLYSREGTPAALESYLEGLFDSVTVEENWEYGGDAFHFRLVLDGKLDEQTAEKVVSAVEKTKNVRSVFDGYSIGSSTALLFAPSVSSNVFYSEMTGDVLCGTVPNDVI